MEGLTGKTRPVTYNDINSLMDQVRNTIFPNFPIYDESHRIDLQNRIMERYMFREIACTPVSQWLFLFRNKMQTIMPKYNPLYKAFGEDMDIFADTNYTRNYQEKNTDNLVREVNDTASGESNTTSNQILTPGVTTIETHNETPQTSLQDFLDNRYLNAADKTTMTGENLTEVTDHTRGQSNNQRNQTDNANRNIQADEVIKGKRGGKTYAELLSDYKNNIFSIDEMIIADLEDMFFCLY